MAMTDVNATIERRVTEQPGRARTFERPGIDGRRGGRLPQARAGAEAGLDPVAIVRERNARDIPADATETVDWLPETASERADAIVATHHAYLRRELPRLSVMADQVVAAHGDRHPELRPLRGEFAAFTADLESHLALEEGVVFPLIKQLEDRAAGGGLPAPARLTGVIHALKHENDRAQAALVRMRALTAGFTPPADACHTYRALLAGLAEMETDLHSHFHKESNLLAVGAHDRDAAIHADGR